MIKRLAHICIYSPDLQKTRWFYQELLGMDTIFEFRREDKVFGFYLGFGEQTFLEVFEGESSAPGNIQHMALEVVDIQAVVKKLRDAGVEVSEPMLGDDHSWQSWVTDPNGIRIEFHEYTNKSLQLHGGICQVSW